MAVVQRAANPSKNGSIYLQYSSPLLGDGLHYELLSVQRQVGELKGHSIKIFLIVPRLQTLHNELISWLQL